VRLVAEGLLAAAEPVGWYRTGALVGVAEGLLAAAEPVGWYGTGARGGVQPVRALGELEVIAEPAAEVNLLERVLGHHTIEADHAKCKHSEEVHSVAVVAVAPFAAVDQELARDGLEEPRHHQLDRNAGFGDHAVDRNGSAPLGFLRQRVDRGTGVESPVAVAEPPSELPPDAACEHPSVSRVAVMPTENLGGQFVLPLAVREGW
jgi:hypothetical protein